ncbi:MAG: GIY-YIG nuclease family protein [bacterium]
MSKGGIYALLISLRRKGEIPIGGLGTLPFEAGYYIYVGSAMGGLKPRIERHRREEKKLHWHIDYLLQYGEIVDVFQHIVGDKRYECELNDVVGRTLNGAVPIEGFGSSDCRCLSHLWYCGPRLMGAGKEIGAGELFRFLHRQISKIEQQGRLNHSEGG